MGFNLWGLAWPAAVLASFLSLSVKYGRHGKGSNQDANIASTSPPVIYSLLQLLTRTFLLAFAAVSCIFDHSTNWVEISALAYVFVLDTTRVLLPARFSELQSSFLHHVNVLVVLETLAVFIQLAPSILFVDSGHSHDHHHDLPLGLGKQGVQVTPNIWIYSKFGAALIALLVAFISPRRWTAPRVSFDLAQRDCAEPSPEQTCSYFSYYLSYSWLSDIVLLGTHRRLVLEDLLPLPEYDEPLIWRERIMAARTRFHSTAMTLAYALRENIAVMVFFAALTAVVEYIAPLALYKLLHHFQDPTASEIRPWVWVALLFAGPVLRSGAYQQYLFFSTRLMVRIKMCLTQELYAKASRCYETAFAPEEKPASDALSAKPKPSEKNSGQSDNLTTLVAFDVDAICTSRDFILVCTSSPIQIAIGFFFLYTLFGLLALVALATLLLSFPLAGVLSRVTSHFHRKLMRSTDRRLAALSEYLAAIRTIKYLGWEPIMASRLHAERAQEEHSIWRRNISSVAVGVMGDFVPLLALFLLFASYSLISGHPLTAAKAFTAVSITEALRLQFVWMANVTRFYAQAHVAFGRIDAYMHGTPEIQAPLPGLPAFREHAVFRRALDPESFRLHFEDDCVFVLGGLNVIAGASGSGKTTLLLSLLGETVLEQGVVTSPKLVSFAPQTPWLINDTIRANILLSHEWDPRRYGRVVFACGLAPDLAQLPAGDLSDVGPNGSSLSGGQRQRVCLARALYAPSALIVLDDVFSALDASTQRHIWQHVFCDEAVLKGRTVVLATQFQAAKTAAALVVELAHGRVVSATSQDRQHSAGHNINHFHYSPQEQTVLDKFVQSLMPPEAAQQYAPGKSAQSTPSHAEAIETRINDEVAGQKRNSRSLFYQYMLYFGGQTRALTAVAFCLVLQLTFFSLPMWLSVWVGHADDRIVHTAYYVAVYGFLLLAFLVASLATQSYLQWGAWTAAHTLHANLVAAALGVAVGWYDHHPAGQFLNRFSRDMFSLDCIVVDFLRISIDNAFRFMLRLTAIGAIMPVFAIPAALVCAVGLVCAEMYTRTQLSVKALQSASQSPIFTFLLEGLSGQAVIRAGGCGSRLTAVQQAFSDDLARRIRIYSRASETQYNLNRWISVRADGCAAVIALATGLLAVSSYSSDVAAGKLGFSLTSAIGLGQTILTMVRSMNELEAELNCFYRVREYASLPHEEAEETDEADLKDDEPYLDEEQPPVSSTSPPLPYQHHNWPSQGFIEFQNVSVKYNADGPDILKNVTFDVHPGERVAIVGRTGSGKSTLALSLLRFTHAAQGSICIDRQDIAAVPLHTLRRRVTIIPQEPVLFGGDVRFNLDPTGEATETQLGDALQACAAVGSTWGPQTQTPVQTSHTLSSSQLSLSTTVSTGGGNFSVGQRQMLSLARAAVRNSRVLILDEATASIDYRTEAAIQEALHSTFRGRTVIAIVHRLSTIVDYDRVVVMDKGRVCEIGQPTDLYQQSESLFRKMVDQSIEHGRGSEWHASALEKLGVEDVQET